MATRNRYRRIEIPKKGGGRRVIEVPSRDLKNRQKELAKRLQPYVRYSKYLHAYSRKKNIRTNAEALLLDDPEGQHVPSCILQMDIKDFFGSVTRSMVTAALVHLSVPDGLIEEISRTCFRTKKKTPVRVSTYRASRIWRTTYLPQGAPTSPVLAHSVLWQMLPRLIGAVNSRTNPLYQTKLSIYCDNITLASDDPDVRHLQFILKYVLEEIGFYVNEKKTRFKRRPASRVVCGAQISEEGIGPPRRFWRTLRADMFNALCDLREGNSPAGFYLEDGARKMIRSALYRGHRVGDPLPPEADEVRNLMKDRVREIPFQTWRGKIAHVSMLSPRKGERLLSLFNQVKEANERCRTSSSSPRTKTAQKCCR
jgi:hypothetical protein